MKNHIIFKFIALLLCAALLTGAVACLGGVAVFTAGNLYNRSVEDMRQEEKTAAAEDYAFWLARNYASTTYGGCSDELVHAQYKSHWFSVSYDPDCYGYAVLDAEGNVLLGENLEFRDSNLKTYSYVPEGNYIHLVSEKTESQRLAEEAAKRVESQEEASGTPEIPEEGAVLQQASFWGLDGSCLLLDYDGFNTTIDYMDPDGGQYNWVEYGNLTGQIYVSHSGQLVYTTLLERGILEEIASMEVSSLMFNPRYSENFRLNGGSGSRAGSLGLLAVWDDQGLKFTTDAAVFEEEPEELARAMAETAPETIEETIPETAAATVPETVAETEVTPITEMMVVAPGEDDMPQETFTIQPVAEAETEPPVTAVETASNPSAPPETDAAEATVPETEPYLINGKTLDNYQVNKMQYWSGTRQDYVNAEYVYLPMPELTVEIYEGQHMMRQYAMYGLLEQVHPYRDLFLPGAFACLLLFVIFWVYLCTAAGRKPGVSEVRAGGLNRLPLDLYLMGGGFSIALLVAAVVELFDNAIEVDILMGCAAALGALFGSCLIFVGFCYAFVAQIKMPGSFWVRNTLVGWFFRGCFRFGNVSGAWMEAKGAPGFVKFCKWLWKGYKEVCIWTYRSAAAVLAWIGRKIRRLGRKCYRSLNRFIGLLPLTWQWILGGVTLLILAAGFVMAMNSGKSFWVLVTFCGVWGIILYAAQSFGILAKAARRMSKGDLDTKVDDAKLVGCFKDSAADLNALADVAVVAAQKQLKSERMKTELITNVSHDIKTPLTSIINYVDLLQKPHSDDEQQQYLEVLDRQSQRLKKLIDDLMDMSKANTGNMTVEITQVDAVESVNQALGEFSDKLARAELVPVVRCSEDSLPMMADGRLVWRVLSNVLSNAVKYALPGTRLYIDLMEMEGNVIISLKNISREELNVDAEELMERFVRGDDSRNTEGSGLGLNIAKSLMELQKGQLQLLVDGDLFKVTLIFPGK